MVLDSDRHGVTNGFADLRHPLDSCSNGLAGLEQQRVVVVSPFHVADSLVALVLTAIDVLPTEPDARPTLSGQLLGLLNDPLAHRGLAGDVHRHVVTHRTTNQLVDLELQNFRPFSVQDHHYSEAILHYLCIFNRKMGRMWRLFCNSYRAAKVLGNHVVQCDIDCGYGCGQHPPALEVLRAVPRIAKEMAIFSIENRRFSGVILHYFCIFDRKFQNKLAFILQFVHLLPERGDVAGV